MPNHVVDDLIKRVIALEIKVESLLVFQKWQMGLLAAILLLAVKNWVR